MNKENVHTIIMPDIHGRQFWKIALEQFPIEEYPNLTVVFLGDYLDPYDFEGISKKSAIENFEEILETAKNDNRIRLLIGNHDMHYWYDAYYKVRFDRKNSKTIYDMFMNSFDMFSIAYEETINGTRYLYTHAGVTSYWLNHLRLIGKLCLANIEKGKLKEERKEFNTMLSNMTPTVNELNMLKSDFQGQPLLWEASWLRGGDNDSGSCIWADFDEWCYENSNIENVFQIFGHSLAAFGIDEGIVDYKHKFAMVDSRQAWVIDNIGNIIKLKDINA